MNGFLQDCPVTYATFAIYIITFSFWYLNKSNLNMPRSCLSFVYNELSQEAVRKRKIFGPGYQLNQGGVEEPNPSTGWKAIDDKWNGDDAYGGRPLIGGARILGTFSGTLFCQHWRLHTSRRLLCFLRQKASFQKRA